MSRLTRKNRPNIGYKGCGDLGDAFDDMIKQVMRVSNEEYDFMLDKAVENDEFMDLIATEQRTISQKRKFLILMEQYLEEYGATQNS